MTFSFAVAAAALALSSSVRAQQVSPEDSLRDAAKLVGELNGSSSAADQIAALKRDFTDFATAYLAAASSAAPAPATAAAVGTSGRVDARADWRMKYQRVEADLAALLGPVGSPPSTSAVSLDADTRTRLETARTHLQIFYAATLGQPDGNPVSHTGAAPLAASELPDATRAPIAPTAQAPQTLHSEAPPALDRPAAQSKPVTQVDMQLGDALAMLDRVQRILDDAIKEPGKISLDRGSIDEMRAEIAQIRSMLQSRPRH